MSKILLNKTSACQCLRFFDVCFKQGVIDAYELGDNIDARDFLQRKESDWSFGVLGKGDFDHQMFRATLYWWARKSKMKSLAESYIFKISARTYNTSFLYYCMRFYLLGIKEWLEYPNPIGIEVFKNTPKVQWTPQDSIKNFCRGDYFSYLHQFAYEFKQIDDDSKPLSFQMMDNFIMALFDLSKKY